MDRRAFTLIELLMVIMIMGILGTISVGGYRAMQRGIEERGVMENVNHFIRAAYRRAQTDRQPTAIYYWNETHQDENSGDTYVVVGKAVAVRRAGRVSRVVGQYLYSEFADLDRERLVVDSEDEDTDNTDSGSTSGENLVPIYKMNSDGSCVRALASSTTKNVTGNNRETLLSRMAAEEIPCYAYVLQGDAAGTWNVGDAYGLEFAEIQLPNGYLFGTDYPTSADSAPTIKGPMWFEVSVNRGSGADQGGAQVVTIYSLRQSDMGDIKPEKVGTSDKPTEDVN